MKVPSGWKLTRLEEFLKYVPRKTEKPSVGYAALGVLSHGKGTFTKEVDDPEKVMMDYLFMVKPEDLIVSIMFAWEGAIALVKPEDNGRLVSHRFPTYVFNRNKCIPHYFKYFMLSKWFFYQLGLISPGGAGRNRVLSKSDFLKLAIPLPPLAEQRRIAEILGAWDQAISLTRRLIEASRRRKQGLMQRLLTGSVRLPGFAGEWREVKFRDVLAIEIGGTPTRNNSNYWDTAKVTENRWLSISDLSGKYVDDSKEYISNEGVKNSNAKLVPAGTVVMSFKLTIGRAAILTKPAYTNEAICSLVPKDGQSLLNDFLYYALEVVNFDKEIDQAVKGKTLNKAKIARLQLMLPPADEQRAIAAVLQTADEEIGLLERKLSALRAQKKGLMQKLLTGEVRVTTLP